MTLKTHFPEQPEPVLPPEHVREWLHGLALFDAGEYWECHEALEQIWKGATSPARECYSGVILLAAAIHKARKYRSPVAARRNFAKALARLAPLPDRMYGVELRKLEELTLRALGNADFKPVVPRI